MWGSEKEWKAGKRELQQWTTYLEQYDQGPLPGQDGSPTTFGIIVLLFTISNSRQRRADWAGLRHSTVLWEESTGLLMTVPADSLYWG